MPSGDAGETHGMSQRKAAIPKLLQCSVAVFPIRAWDLGGVALVRDLEMRAQ